MRLVLNRILLLICGILLICGTSPIKAAKSITERLPAKPNHLVNNLSASSPQFLTAQETMALENKLTGFANEKNVQVTILITDDLLDLDPNDYVTRVFNKWGVGDQKTNQGVLVLVKPTQPRQIYIGTGYGSEEFLPDITCKQIIEKIIKPQFQAGHYYQGLDQASDAIISVFSGNNSKPAQDQVSPFGLILLIVFMLMAMFLIERFGRNSSSVTLGPRHRHRYIDTSPSIIPLIGLGSFRGGSDFGGGFGGGFGGFGGGHGGGGGAGGSW